MASAGRLHTLDDFGRVIDSGAIFLGNSLEPTGGAHLVCIPGGTYSEVYFKAGAVDFESQGCKVAHGVFVCLFDDSKIRLFFNSQNFYAKIS